MTGTADTEAEEFAKIYNLDVIVIPPNRPLRRIENPDLVYRTEKEKWDAIVTEIVDEHAKGRPVLVGTVSIEKSEKLSTMLDRAAEARHDDRRRRRQARRAEREVPRAGSRVRRAGRAARARSRSPPTWPAAAPTSCSAATPSSWRASSAWPSRSPSGCPRAKSASSRTSSSSTSTTSTRSIACRRPDYERIFEHFKQQTRRRARRGRRARRPAHRRHRAARGAAHRQPAARPRRPPGRSRARRASICRSKTT